MKKSTFLRQGGVLVGLMVWLGCGIGFISAADKLETGKPFQLRDEFDGKLTLDWKPVRPDPPHVSLDKHPGKLTIVTQRGSIHGNEKEDTLSLGTQAKNLYMIPNPASAGRDFVITTRVVSFAPKTSWHQAGLMVYNDDDNYLKCDLEFNSGAPSDMVSVFLRETDQKSDFFAATPKEKGDTFWLRVIKRGKLYEYAFSADGDTYTIVGEKRWGDGAPKSVGLFAKNGGNPLAGKIDAQFDFFEVRSLTDEERNQPEYVARRELQGTWDVIAFERSGKAIEDLGLSQFTFDDGEVTVTEKGKNLKTECSVDLSKEPRRLVFAGLFSSSNATVPAFYSVSGSTLKICLEPGSDGVPTEMVTKEGDGRLLFTLRRVGSSE